MLRYLGCPLRTSLHGSTWRHPARSRRRVAPGAWDSAGGIDGGDAPGGVHSGEALAAGNFAAAAQALLADDAKQRLILTGSRGERALCEVSAKRAGRPTVR